MEKLRYWFFTFIVALAGAIIVAVFIPNSLYAFDFGFLVFSAISIYSGLKYKD